MKTPRPPRTVALDLAVVAAVAVVARVWFRVEVHSDPLFHLLAIDARSYVELARRFAGGDFLYGREALWFAPLYPTLLGAFFRVFGDSPEAYRLVQHALGVGTAAIGYLLGARWSRSAGWWAGGLLGVTPVLVFYENQLLYASFATFFVALFLWTFVRALQRDGALASGLAGVVLGLLALLRTNVVLFAPVALAFLAVRAPRANRIVAFGVGVGLVLGVVLARNGIGAGEWTPFTVNGGMILATGLAEDSVGARALARTPQDFGPGGAYQREAEAAVGRSLTLKEASDWHRARALAAVRDDPGRVAVLTWRKALLFLNAAEVDDQLSLPVLGPRATSLSWWPAPWAWFLLPAAFALPLVLARSTAGRGEAAVHLAFAVVWLGSLLPFFFAARYRLPVVVPLAVLGGAGVALAREHVATRRWGPLVAGTALAGLLAVGVFRDSGVRSDPGFVWNALGAALRDDGRPAAAVDALRRAEAVSPELPAIHVNLGLAQLDLGRLAEAEAAARRATELDPELAGGWRVLGTVLARQERYGEALEAFRRDVQRAPHDAQAWRNFAQALWVTGRREEAVYAGREVVSRGDRSFAAVLERWISESAP